MGSKLLAIILIFIDLSLSFNLSPYPSSVLKFPIKTLRKSYFGFSLNLRKSHILIGAPRANSTLPSQLNIKEPGLIFKCTFDSKCVEFWVDRDGNKNERPNHMEAELKDFRLLGFSMDGRENEQDKFVVCAPKQLTDFSDNLMEYFMFGACYYTQNTISDYPQSSAITPLKERGKEYFKRHPYYVFGESGFSTHFLDRKDEIISGCPGVADWKGSVNHFNFKTRKDDKKYQGTVLNVTQNNILDSDNYFGYSLTSGQFLMPQSPFTFYVGSAPRNNYNGSVLIFSIISQIIITHYTFRGDEYGSYFGYAVICDDFNNDGKPDLAVSAPFYSEKRYYENGAVYIYFNDAVEYFLNFKEQEPLKPEYEEANSRFGMALGKIGDIDGDGYNDLAISGNFKGKAVLYIYRGSKDEMKLSQKVEISDANSIISISRGVDIDRNGFKDLAVGIPESDSVYIYKTYPVIEIHATLKASKNQLNSQDQVSITACINITSKVILNFKVQFSTKLFIASPISYAKSFAFSQILTQNFDNCVTETFDMRISPTDVKEMIIFKYKYELRNPQGNQRFCDKCVAINPQFEREKSLSLPISVKCAKNICEPNLKLTGLVVGAKDQILVGSDKNISMNFSLSNLGEPAFSTELSMLIPDSTKLISFSKICTQSEKLICEINFGKAFIYGENINISIVLDVSKVRGNFLNIIAEASSNGAEINGADNFKKFNLALQYHSNIKVTSSSPVRDIDIKVRKILKTKDQNVKQTYTIFNEGPSPMKNFQFEVLIPKLFVKERQKIELIKIESIEMFYNGQILQMHGNPSSSQNEKFPPSINDHETILLDCDQNYIECIKANGTIINFEASAEKLIEIVLNYEVMNKNIDKILNETKFRMILRAKLVALNVQEDLRTFKITEKDFSIIIQKQTNIRTPIWIWIVSALSGIILLLLLMLILYKCGFFTREMKKELKKKKRETMTNQAEQLLKCINS